MPFLERIGGGVEDEVWSLFYFCKIREI